MEYNYKAIEEKWRNLWQQENAYKTYNDTTKPKCYVLDMFPYPSGAGLHVGHPLGYIASDIYARYKRLKGYNVLHPMGYDAFGLPAEQYAIDNGIHPTVSTAKNIATFEAQLNNIGFSYDWSRKINTSEPQYYKWTQWIFLELYNAFYNIQTDKAEKIEVLQKSFAQHGSNTNLVSAKTTFSAAEYNSYTQAQQLTILMQYRIAYCGYGEVNWCEALGTVLANDEVVNGISERGGHPVQKKKLRQWYLRITDYANRLLQGLNTVNFSEPMKDMQRNWIGQSYGANITFAIHNNAATLEVYTTRPDTIFGVDFMVVAPEHELIASITTTLQQAAISEYITYVKSRSDVERMAEKKVTGCFTGAYAINPFNQRQIPIYISEYVLAGYGTGAIMAVPCGDERDHKFALQYNIPITNIIGNHYNGREANPTKDAVLHNSDFLNGIVMKDAIVIAVTKLSQLGVGSKKTNYKMRDAAFSRQRYWGEPFPIVWIGDVAYSLPANNLPLELPQIDEIKPGENAQGPLANNTTWVTHVDANLLQPKPTEINSTPLRETSTMPGYAGSSWYFLRYADACNTTTFCERKLSDYWNQVDVYVGGTEHAVGHLLYSRMWTKVLYDLGHIGFDEPFKKLVNQGMITGSSRFMYRLQHKAHQVKSVSEKPKTSAFSFIPLVLENGDIKKLECQNYFGFNDALVFFSTEYAKVVLENKSWNEKYELVPVRVDVNCVDGLLLNVHKLCSENFNKYDKSVFINSGWAKSFNGIFSEQGLADFTKEEKDFSTFAEVEKMSKSKLNTINPNDIVSKYGADTFRLYEMFLGPVEMSKPWDTKGIEGVHRFLKKLWRLFYHEEKGLILNHEKATAAELKILHRTIKKIEEDTERFNYNTAISAFMIAINELSELKCNKAEILAPLLILLHPYAPHITAELYELIHPASKHLPYGVTNTGVAIYPTYNPALLIEDSKLYPISINGKMRTTLTLALSLQQAEVETIVLQNEVIQKWLDGKQPEKIIYIKNKMVNVVVK